jgi:hypothetical protein
VTAAVTAILEDAERSNFWGSIELTFNAGRLMYARRTQTFKFNPDTPRKPNPEKEKLLNDVSRARSTR